MRGEREKPAHRVTLTRTVGFRATHRYWVAEWSAERNQAHFGPATQEHPHDYRCAATVSGSPDPDTDMIVELPELDRILQEEIIARFDGKNLNRDSPEFAEGGMLPSCEALARYCYKRVEERLPEGVTLERVKISEDATLSAEVSGER